MPACEAICRRLSALISLRGCVRQCALGQLCIGHQGKLLVFIYSLELTWTAASDRYRAEGLKGYLNDPVDEPMCTLMRNRDVK